MVTFTIRHHQGDKLEDLMRGLMLSLARVRRQRAIRAIWTDKVTASIRSTEVTHGANGWHPHLHIVLRTKGLTNTEKKALRHAWRAAVSRELGAQRAPSLANGVAWSRALDATDVDPKKLAGYLFKLGCEIVGTAKAPRVAGSIGSWELAALAVTRDPAHWRAWSEFQVATKGRRSVELDDRAARAVRGLPVSAILGFGVEVECPQDTRPEPVTREIAITSDELRAMRRAERTDRFALIRPMIAASQAVDPVCAVRAVIDAAVSSYADSRARDGPAVA